jgi:hypothetical protein
MKKFLTIFLSVIYLAFTSGVVLSVHYCMGEVAGVALGHEKADKCGTCGMDNDGCCQDDVKVIKVSDAHSLANTVLPLVKAEASLMAFRVTVPAALNFCEHPSAETILTHPDPGTVPRYLRNRVFRI